MTRSRLVRSLALPAALLAAGCAPATTPSAAPPAATPPTAVRAGDDGHHGHEHTRDKMMLAEAGKYHLWLTAHLSAKDGNELDVFSDDGENTDAKPVALPVDKLTAKAKRAGDDTEYELVFEPAPADERPKGEKPGTCSHFVAKAPWLKPGDGLTVTAEFAANGRRYKPTWRAFTPAKYAHHTD